MKRIIFFLLSLAIPFLGEASDLSLLEKLSQGDLGDFVVTQQDKNYSLLHLYGRRGDTLVIEEVTVPRYRLGKNKPDWRDWLEEGAPGNTSWVMYDLHIPSGEVREMYSFSRGGHLDSSQANDLMGTLLRLDFDYIPEDMRYRSGAPPRAGGPDFRPPWQPPLYFEGRRIPQAKFDAFATIWPMDGSDIAGRRVEVFFPKEGQNYPAYFPYWLKVGNNVAGAKVRVVDGGKGLQSPMDEMPRRVPEVAGTPRVRDEYLVISLHVPTSYDNFYLAAVGTVEQREETILLPHEVYSSSRLGEVELWVPLAEMEGKIHKGYDYRILVAPASFPELVSQAPLPQVFP